MKFKKIARYFIKKLQRIRLSLFFFWVTLMEIVTRHYLSFLYRMEKPAENYRKSQRLMQVLPPIQFENDTSRYNWHER